MPLGESSTVQLLPRQWFSSCHQSAGALADQGQDFTLQGFCSSRSSQLSADVRHRANDGFVWVPLRRLRCDVGQDRAMERCNQKGWTLHPLHDAVGQRERMPPPLLLRYRLFDGMVHNLHRTETFSISLLVFKCRRRLLITSSRLLDVIKLMEGFISSCLPFCSGSL